MIKCFRFHRTATATLKPTLCGGVSATSPLRFNTKSDTSASIFPVRPVVDSHSRRNRSAFPPKSLVLHPLCKRASSSASTNHGGIKRTALHELHVTKGGKMVPFGGYSMPVHYSDLGVGESHKWTREKASLFDVGHM